MALGDALRPHPAGYLVTDSRGRRPAAHPVPAVDHNVEVVRALSERLGHAFRDPELLAAALTHPSLRGRAGAAKHGEDFERLEFLGDRVLSLVVADWLFTRFP